MLDLFIAHLWTVCWPCKDAWNVPVTRGVRCDKSVARGQWAENATSTNGIPITQANYANPAIILSKVFHCASKSHIPVEQHERNHKISGSIKAAATKKERKICKRKKNSSLETFIFFTYVDTLEFVVSQHHSQTFIWISPFSLKDYRFTTLEQGCCLPGNLTANPQPLPYKSLPW